MSINQMRAGGDIIVSTFVKPSTTEDHTVLQAEAGGIPSGIAQNAGRLHPSPDFSQADISLAAKDGESLQVHTAGETSVDLLCGGTWTAGDFLIPMAGGGGTPATGGSWAGARALTAGVIGRLCPVEVLQPTWVPAS